MARLRSREAETEDVNQRRLRRGAVKRTHLTRWAVGADELAPGVVGDTHLHPSTHETIREVAAAAGVGQLLVVSATGQSFASGGAYVTADTIVHQHGFAGVTAAGDSIMWPVDYAGGWVQVEFAWDTYTGGGTIEIEVDGVVPAWGLIGSGSSGQVGCKGRGVDIAEGSVVKVKVTQASGVAKTADVFVEFSAPDPSLTIIPEPTLEEQVAALGTRLWYRPESLLMGNGDNVSTWVDSSGNGHDATWDGSATRPTYQATAVGGYGGVRFQYSGGGPRCYLLIPQAAYLDLTAVEAFTVVAVTDNTGPSGQDGGLFQVGNDNDAAHYSSGGVIRDDFGSTARQSFTPSIDIETYHLYNVVSVAGEWTARINGAVEYTGGNTVGWNSVAGFKGQAMGNTFREVNVHFSFDGVIVETIWFDRKLSAGTRATVHEYLTDKYGIVIA